MSVQRLGRVEANICGADATVADALARIDQATPHLFQIVISGEGRVLGTITDGDVRRAMLRGVTMADTVDKCMRKTPLLGRAGEEVTNRVLLRRAWFLPVVDESGRLDHVLVQRRFERPFNRALVMAGGFGRRLGKLTRETPKPLLSVGGRPILDRVLAQLEAAGISAIHLAVHYRAEQIRDFIARRSNLATVDFIEETEPLGTAGALARLSNHIEEPLLVANGDVLTQIDYGALHEFHARHGYDGTVAVSRYEMQVPFGVIRQTADGLFAGIDEKPRMTHFVAAGLYYLSPEFIALTPRGRPVDMPELLTLASGAGLRIGLFPVHEYWKDVGRPSDLAAADQDHEGK
jgi:dTDP-glucose pyrophosphorylase